MTGIRISLVRAWIVAILVSGAGCAGNGLNANLASWQGSHIDEVKSAWGAPDECADQQGRRICTWSDRADPEITGYVLQPRPSCLKMLAIDESGYITGWRWRGSRCPDTATIARVE